MLSLSLALIKFVDMVDKLLTCHIKGLNYNKKKCLTCLVGKNKNLKWV